uniref:Transmembrane protein n=1 Tax=Leptocylindrus danicus TaxID=163516 RepID=A0A7S2L4K0_9STRA|mmetsp:Transcript_314/g.425  ORF Transcript_314/g.425 Transcript_314/m.425 type:complete len:582 (+) Transcript_314:35-1780(+)
MEQPLLYNDVDSDTQEVISISLSSKGGYSSSDEVTTTTCSPSSGSGNYYSPVNRADDGNHNAEFRNSGGTNHNNNSYISLGICGCTVFMILFEVFMVATFMSMIWSSVVLRTYSDSNRVYKEVTLEEYDIDSILKTFQESDVNNALWFFLCMLIYFTPIAKIVLQILALAVMYAGPPPATTVHGLNAPLLIRGVSDSSSSADDSSSSSTSSTQQQRSGLCGSSISSIAWQNRKWKLVELYVYQISPVLTKLTGAVIYAFLLLLAVTSVDFHLSDENNTTYQIRVPLEGGSFTFFLASLASISVGNLLMHQMDRILEEVRLEGGGGECGNAARQTTAGADTECPDCDDEYTENLAQEQQSPRPTSTLQQTSASPPQQSRSSGEWHVNKDVLNVLAVAAFSTGVVVWFSPVVEVKYYGPEAVLLEEQSTQYYLWNLFRYVYKSVDYRMDAVFLFACLVTEVVVLPNAVFALTLALKECQTRSTTSARIASILQYVRPFMNLESFVIGLLIFGSTVEYVFDYTFNDMYNICSVAGMKNQTMCLGMSVSFLEGTWLLVIFSLSLVTFVSLLLPVSRLSNYRNVQE